MLKKLDIKLNKIGIDLGVEGFEPEQPTGVRIGDVSGQVHGDIVGWDKNTSNFFDKLEKSVQNIVIQTTTPCTIDDIINHIKRWVQVASLTCKGY